MCTLLFCCPKRINALKCRTLGVRTCANPWNHALDLLNGNYTEDFRQKTETKQKEAWYLTLSGIPGIVSLFRTIGRLCCQKVCARNVAAEPYNAGSGVYLQRSGFKDTPQKIAVSMPALFNRDFSHLANVKGLCGFTTARNSFVLSVSYWARKDSVFCSYTCRVAFGQSSLLSKTGKKNSALGLPTLDCLARPASWNVTPSGE